MEKFVAFIKKYGIKGIVALILFSAGVFLLTSVTSCSTVRAGYERTRYIESVDSTYIHYKPTAQNVELDRMTRARVTRVRDVRVRTNHY